MEAQQAERAKTNELAKQNRQAKAAEEAALADTHRQQRVTRNKTVEPVQPASDEDELQLMRIMFEEVEAEKKELQRTARFQKKQLEQSAIGPTREEEEERAQSLFEKVSTGSNKRQSTTKTKASRKKKKKVRKNLTRKSRAFLRTALTV